MNITASAVNQQDGPASLPANPGTRYGLIFHRQCNSEKISRCRSILTLQ